VTHTLSKIDTSRRRALCAACGEVVSIIKNGHGGWRCSEANKGHHRVYRDQGRHREHLRQGGSSCAWCGFTPAVVAGRRVLGMLHVHHRDGDRTNNEESNLVTLCGHCHTCVHATDRLPGPQRIGERIKIMLRAGAERRQKGRNMLVMLDSVRRATMRRQGFRCALHVSSSR
jgi:HNH endonuclease